MFSYLYNVIGDAMNKEEKKKVPVEEVIFEEERYRSGNSYVSPTLRPNTYSIQAKTSELGRVDVGYRPAVALEDYKRTTQEYKFMTDYPVSYSGNNNYKPQEVFVSNSPTYTSPSYTTQVETYSTNPNYSGNLPLAGRSSGWVVFNDKKVERLIQSFNDLDVMPRADPTRLKNLEMDNYEKIILVYLYRDGYDDDLNNLIGDLKKFCSGALYLIILREDGTTGPRNVNYMAPRKYSIFTVRRDQYSDEYTVDKDERRKLGDFIRLETVYTPAIGVTNVVDYRPNQYAQTYSKPIDTEIYRTTDARIEGIIAGSPTRRSQVIYDKYDGIQPVVVATRPYGKPVEEFTSETDYQIKYGSGNTSNYNL
jgi:hypothetical protein